MIEAVAIISGRYLAHNINLGGDPLRHLFQSLFNCELAAGCLDKLMIKIKTARRNLTVARTFYFAIPTI